MVQLLRIDTSICHDAHLGESMGQHRALYQIGAITPHFVARAGAEATLFGLAYQLEAAHPWADRWAPRSYPVFAP